MYFSSESTVKENHRENSYNVALQQAGQQKENMKSIKNTICNRLN